jgi:hypothetical protein
MQRSRGAQSPTRWVAHRATGPIQCRRPWCRRGAPDKRPSPDASPAAKGRAASAWRAPSPPAHEPATRRAASVCDGSDRPRRQGRRSHSGPSSVLHTAAPATARWYPRHARWHTPPPQPPPTDARGDTVSRRPSSGDARGLGGPSAGACGRPRLGWSHALPSGSMTPRTVGAAKQSGGQS